MYAYKKIDGVKYYKDSNTAFSLINDKLMVQSSVDANSITNNKNGINYYKAAYDFKEKFKSGGIFEKLRDLKTSDAVDVNGNSYTGDNNPYSTERYIFRELFNISGKYIEDEDSEFNVHKMEVIKNSIESNLMVAISNYNTVSTSEVNFAMPKLQDYEWEELTKNISMITFLQGLSIGGKVYNGYAIVRNDLTEDFVSENSIYIAYNGKYYRVTDTNLIADGVWNDNATGILNTDFERRTTLVTAKSTSGDGTELSKNIYYYPRYDEGAYSSIINLNNIENKNINEYLKDGIDGKYGASNGERYYKLAQIYYTALGRERYGMYRINKWENLQQVYAGLD